jgi:ribonuclease P protein component
MNQKYTKEEHLKGNVLIKHLFEKGSWVNKYPIKVIYCESLPSSSLLHKTGVSVSKRNFRRAVDRNRIKRLLRECFRLHKKELYLIFPSPHLFMIIYTGKEILSFHELEKKYLQLLEKLKNSNV